MDWNLLITIGVIIVILFWIINRMFGLSPLDLIGEIKDFMGDKKDAVVDKAVEIYE